MSTPTKMSEKNTSPERRSVRVMAKSSKRSSADESPKNPVPAIERMVSDAGLKRKQGEMDVKDSKKLISALEDKISKSEEVFHNIVMRLTDHSGMSDALCFELSEDLGRFSINELCLITGLKCVGSTHLPVVESRLISRYFSTLRVVSRENLELQMSNSKFDNDDDAVKLSLLYIIFCIPLLNASSVKIDPKFFVMADNLDAFNDFPWGVLSWEATRAAICNTIENKMSSKRRPLKKNDKIHYSITGFPHALLVWSYETLPSIASKFTTKYDQAIPRMMSWTTADNVMFNDIFTAFITVGKSQLKCFALMPTDEELKNPWVARLYLKKPKDVPQLPPPKSSIPRPSTDTKRLPILRRVLKMLSANMIEKTQGKAQTAPHVSSSQEFNVSRAESDVLQTTSPDIGAVTDMGVQAAMEFLTADKVIISHEDAENEKNKVNIKDRLEGNEGEANVKSEPFVEIKEESMPDLEKGVKKEKDDKEIIREQDVIKLEEPANVESILAVIPKKKRARLSRLGQRPSGRMTEVGSPSKAPSKLIYALPPGLADEPPKETLEEFKEWINKGVLKRTPLGKWPPRYNAKHETLDKPHDLGFMEVDKKSWYYELATSPVWLWNEHIGIVFYYLRKKIRQFPELEQRKSGSSWFEVNTLLIPIHLADLKHWALVKLDLTSWTIEVYDSLQHGDPHNSKVREGV
ncbi:hypothetical protein TIFTF001_028602 [Ficus carica]|uniref:Ubiquitin-like protease family profile domain-containing protein n=1 Tax=Ficus carica TaxID=3494 RepID=A0AA88IWS0_FICCA|nr:hypothetical protein TIFTF001_028602 [Ficus carica]